MKDTSTLRLQIPFLVTALLTGLQSVAVPTIISAAEQEMPRRHSLIQRSAVESSALPAASQGMLLQSPSAEPTRITSPIGPLQTSVSLPARPLRHHRTLASQALGSAAAPATSSKTFRAAVTSGVAAGQVTQATVDTSKGLTPTATAPITKTTGTPFPVITSTGSAAVAPTAPSPFVGTAGVRSVASAGSGSAPSSSGSRSALNLLQSSAVAGLLQPPTPVVSTPSSPPPPATPPSTPPPSSPSTGNVTLSWAANREPDLAGYKVYVGTASGTYSFPGSAFVTGKVTSYTVSNLPKGQTYFFAMSAYDSAGNESVLSAEVSKTLY